MFKKVKKISLVGMVCIQLVSFSKMTAVISPDEMDRKLERLGFTFDTISTVAKIENHNLHKYYISVSNATYSKRSKSIQMVTRFFIDDLEDVINARIEDPIELGNNSTIEEVYPLLKSYLAKKLEVQINGVNSIPNFIGAEYEGDQIVLYIELPSKNVPDEVTMRFNAFLELFEGQKNLVHMNINGERRTLLIDKNKRTDTAKFS
jgi:hypothetical protein